jgi:signal transduction histidine kinase
MDHYLISDTTGRTIVSRLDPGCKENCFDKATTEIERCQMNKCPRKRGRISLPNGIVFLCTDNPDLLKSNRVFLRTLQFYGEMLASFEDIRDEVIKRAQTENNRLVHNLTTLNTHIIQEIYSIASQDTLTGVANNQISEIRKAIEKNPDNAASAALRILKSAIAARAEMQIVRRLRSMSQSLLSQKNHQIHKVIKNVLITFFQDFQEKKISFTLGECHASVLFDYECVSVALYRLFENAIKYCKEDSDFGIFFEERDRHLHVILQMESIPILAEERERIFEEGFSGQIAEKLKLSGEGLGLFFVRQMLALNGARIWVEPGGSLTTFNLEKFSSNRFIIAFPPGSFAYKQ